MEEEEREKLIRVVADAEKLIGKTREDYINGRHARDVLKINEAYTRYTRDLYKEFPWLKEEVGRRMGR